MRLTRLLWTLFLIVMGFALISGQRSEHINLRKKYRHLCLHRRCMPLHSRVPFP
ncbi:apelin receptor early endogenous ligand [Amia ocellicauda]|uniref:apelin receptor early endogenous ligand n=1 Tax=Amia ocellicauda TaxID=2972642 RepID=UPI0034642D64